MGMGNDGVEKESRERMTGGKHGGGPMRGRQFLLLWLNWDDGSSPRKAY